MTSWARPRACGRLPHRLATRRARRSDMQREQGIRRQARARARGQRTNQTARLIGAILPLVTVGGVTSALAQTMTWDASPSNPAAANDGGGTWNTTSAA